MSNKNLFMCANEHDWKALFDCFNLKFSEKIYKGNWKALGTGIKCETNNFFLVNKILIFNGFFKKFEARLKYFWKKFKFFLECLSEFSEVEFWFLNAM